MKKKTTIYDIAKKLNITAATVSRALNNQSDVSEATKELVLKTAQKMNYEQNKLALALKSGKSNNVGVIVPRVDTNFFGSVIRGIEQELNPHGYHIIICQTDGNEIKATNVNYIKKQASNFTPLHISLTGQFNAKKDQAFKIVVLAENTTSNLTVSNTSIQNMQGTTLLNLQVSSYPLGDFDLELHKL